MYVCVCVCVRVCVCVCVCTYVPTHTHTHTHTHTCIHAVCMYVCVYVFAQYKSLWHILVFICVLLQHFRCNDKVFLFQSVTEGDSKFWRLTTELENHVQLLINSIQTPWENMFETTLPINYK